MPQRNSIANARELRQRQTKAEAILWSVLRGKQVCGLKFRRQHPVPPFILDFACVAENLAVEIDGGYHDQQYEKDQDRDQYLIDRGWRMVRFTNEEVCRDPESVAIAIANYLGRKYVFQKRDGGISSVSDRQRIRRDQLNRNRPSRRDV